MSYYLDFESFKDLTNKAKSFMLVVYSGGKVNQSSAIPIIALDDVMVEVDLVRMEGAGISIWKHSGSDGQVTTFPPGTVEKIDIQIN